MKKALAGSNRAATYVIRSGYLTTFVVLMLVTIGFGQTQFTPSGAGNAAAPPAVSTYSSGTSQSTSPAVSLPSANQNPFLGSVPVGKATNEVIPLSFSDAIARGLQQNLGLLLSADSTMTARGQRWKELSNLLPNFSAGLTENLQTVSLAQFGFKIPGIPQIIGPYNYLDARASFSQSVFNWNYIQNQRASVQNVKSAEYSYKDARELVVFAVGNAYLQTIAASSRVDTAQAQVTTARALYTKAVDQQRAGVTAAIDTLRAQVEFQARQQQLIVARNDFAKNKLSLARVIGLPPGQEFTLTDKAPYEPLLTPGLQESLQHAYASRSDYQAALAKLRAAELSRRAATAQHYPDLGFEADYGDIGVSPFHSNGTYHVEGSLRIPIFAGGRTHADVLQTESVLRQNQQQVDNLRAQIDNDVRVAMLDLNAANDQVQVARSSVDLAQQTLTQAQDRFSAGVADNLEVIQAQEAVATANENYISSLYAHNIAKVEYARAIGFAEQGVKQYLKGK
ncbi:MAG TPA: TolC family protein [Terriglobales bacterium]|nr:TolC family protein [Terriglobales bacterium]